MRRFRSDTAFAAVIGTAPIPTSSGQTQRQRPNRGGNRQLNRALHVRPGAPSARAYVARSGRGDDRARGTPLPTRRLADVVYRTMLLDLRAGEIGVGMTRSELTIWDVALRSRQPPPKVSTLRSGIPLS